MQGNVEIFCSLKRGLQEILEGFLNMVLVACFCSLKTNLDSKCHFRFQELLALTIVSCGQFSLLSNNKQYGSLCTLVTQIIDLQKFLT